MIIFITGRPGSGKSSLIIKLIEETKKKNIAYAGIITPEIRKNKTRYGFKIIDLTSGKEQILASVDIKPAKVSKYGVNIEGIDKIVDIFLKSFDKADVVFLDELGKMEFFSDKFKTMINKILKSDKIVIAVLHRNYVDKFKNKGKIFYLSRETFDDIKKEILKLF